MITGQQIIIEPSNLNDKRKIYEWLCLSETAKCHMGPPNFEDTPILSWEEYCVDFDDYYFDGSKPENGQLWIIKYANEEIGAICYSSFHLKANSAELDIWMETEKSCGRGLGSEAIKLFCDYLQQNHGIEKFIIRPSKRNQRAIRAYEKAGFMKVSDEDKQKVVQEYLRDEYLDIYGQGDYGIGDDVALIKCKDSSSVRNSESDKLIKQKLQEIRLFFESNADPAIVAKYSRYFKEGYNGYGIDQKVFENQRDVWFREWNSFSIDDFLNLGDQLILSGTFEDVSIAIAFISLKKDHYSIKVFNHMKKWLERFTNWANTDVLCMLVLSHCINEKIIEPETFIEWTSSQSKWTRRAVPVTFYEAVKAGENPAQYFPIIESIMLDAEEDVQKGLGTFLRESWKKSPEITEDFLLEWKDSCGRKIIQYATEKMDKEYRKKFRRDK